VTASKRPGARAPARTLETVTAKQAIAAALSLRGIAGKVRIERITTEWTDLVGSKIAARTRPRGIHGRALVIEVASSAWLQELTMLRPQLLAQLLTRIGEPRLFDEISFRIAGR
jgi:predicted nucleic acid-binding Zn ribbon protein